MNEAEWNACADPRKLLEFLRDSGKASDRQLRLFAAACYRRAWGLLGDERGRRAVEVAERLADGEANDAEVASTAAESTSTVRDIGTSAALSPAQDALIRAAKAVIWLDPFSASHYAALAVVSVSGSRDFSPLRAVRDTERAAQAVLLRGIMGPLPFRQVHIDPSLLTKHDALVRRLAQAAYDDRHLPEGTLDNGRLAVLADSLEEAGSTDEEILTHLRGEASHVRGCWVIDLLLGKS